MSIKYSESIKKPEQEIEYTPEMIMELNKCSEDIWEFLKYIKIIHPDKGVINYEPYEFQKKILKNLQNNRFNVILASRQSGKCLSGNVSIKIKNKHTDEEMEITMKEFFEMLK